MIAKKLYSAYQQKKESFHQYIDAIKKNSARDIYTIINDTLIKNPYTSRFPKSYFTDEILLSSKIVLFLKSSFEFYLKNIYKLISYFIAFLIYKIYFKKDRKNKLKTIIDIFGFIDKTNQNKSFVENYLPNVYEVFDKHNKQYALLVRPYQVSRNPFKLIPFFKILNEDHRDFIFEYELLKISHFVRIFYMVLIYPFKTLRLLQQNKKSIDTIFNQSLLEDIKYFNFDSLTRYVLGINLAKIESIEKIFSWSEFQVIERSFNYGIRKNNQGIELIALQLFLNYEVYFNTHVEDFDYELLSSPHKVLVNGTYYLLDRQKIKYETGVSLRYKDVFNFKGIKQEKHVLLLGSYIENDTKYMLDSMQNFDNIIFKNHPAVDIRKFGKLPENISISTENIYTLFENTKLVISTASGTGAEAVACGISVIIIASQNNLTANPLIEYGKGEIWDIAYTQDEVKTHYNKLLRYRAEHYIRIQEIAQWYKDNFFIEPTEQNILKAFDINS